MKKFHILIIVCSFISINSLAQTKKISLKSRSSNNWKSAIKSIDNFGLGGLSFYTLYPINCPKPNTINPIKDSGLVKQDSINVDGRTCVVNETSIKINVAEPTTIVFDHLFKRELNMDSAPFNIQNKLESRSVKKREQVSKMSLSPLFLYLLIVLGLLGMTKIEIIDVRWGKKS